MAWATVEQVEDITGKEFTLATVKLSSAMIDTFTGADEGMPEDAITLVDRNHLRKATAWQCFFAVKPGLLEERESSLDVSSDSQRVSREDRADIMLHPMARREILNLSWVGTRTVILPPVSPSATYVNFLNEGSDSNGIWSPV